MKDTTIETTTTELPQQTQKGLEKIKQGILKAIDENGNGEIDLEDVIIKGLRVPGIRIKREDFLRKALMKHYPQEVIDVAVEQSPMKAKIPLAEIDKIADEVIKFERNCVSGISAALSIPGGVAMVATIPADIAQYYGYLLRATQKLLYLYGFPEIDTGEQGSKFDDGTMNTLMVCFAVMYGAVGANNALKQIATALSKGIEKQLLKKALTKGTVYPIVKNVATKWFGTKMNKQIFAGFFRKSIPVVGGVIGGAVTYFSFKPCCDKLKKSLQDTILSNPQYKPTLEDDMIIDECIEGTVVE
ncbi:MAG: hypothetical protein IJF66_00305 [Clostridia bacterium]|nr:hypothetical protein [Clostridia bacterium]